MGYCNHRAVFEMCPDCLLYERVGSWHNQLAQSDSFKFRIKENQNPTGSQHWPLLRQ
jgi:hypothetical protein